MISKEQLNWRQRMAFESLWLAACTFAMLPYWFKFYAVRKFLGFMLGSCVRYRREVVDRNLCNSFPEKNARERAVIRRRFYQALAEVIVATINMAGMSTGKVLRMVTMSGVEEHRKAVAGHDWIAMTAHYGCWEYCACWGAFDPLQMTVAVYHPLQSPVMECFYQRLRNCRNSVAVPMHDSLRFYLRNRGQEGRNLVMGLIADQNPPKRPGAYWFRFLNQDTLFFDGGEKLALRCNLPVYFVKLSRVRPGCYDITFERIYDGVEEVAENEITERYVRCLENMIREQPELWLWSHRRWKHKRPHVEN